MIATGADGTYSVTPASANAFWAGPANATDAARLKYARGTSGVYQPRWLNLRGSVFENAPWNM